MIGLSPLTAYHYARWRARFEAFQRDRPAEALVDQVRAFLAALPMGSRYPARSALQFFLDHAVPWKKIRLRYRRNEPRLQASILGPEERLRLAQSLVGPREPALIHCLWTLRRADVAALRWDHLDLGQGRVLIPRGKGDKPAMVLLPAEAQAALAAWHAANGRPASGPVFPSPRYRRPVAPMTVSAWIDVILRRAGLKRPYRAAHAFRRTLATAFLKANPEDLVGLKALLRHEDIATTARYVFLDPEDLAPRLARVSLFGGNGSAR